MGVPSNVNRLFTDLLRPDALRAFMAPTGNVAGITLTGGGANVYGAWTDIILLAGITQDTLIDAVAVDAFGTAADIYTIDIGTTMSLGINYANAAAVILAGAPSIAGAHRQEIHLVQTTLAGPAFWAVLPFPIFVPAGTGIIARQASVTGGHTCGVAVQCAQNF